MMPRTDRDEAKTLLTDLMLAGYTVEQVSAMLDGRPRARTMRRWQTGRSRPLLAKDVERLRALVARLGVRHAEN
jgi:hypothetical protein